MFRIRRLPREAAPPALSTAERQPAPPASPAHEPESAPEIAAESAGGERAAVAEAAADAAATGGLFTSPAGVLSFLAAIAGAGLADGAVCRRAPEGAAPALGGEWWAEVEVPWEDAASYARTAGGRAFEAIAGRWLEVPLLAAANDGARAGAVALDVRGWPLVELADLVATLRLQPGHVTSLSTLDVVVPGELGRWVLRRASALGLGIRLQTARRHELRGGGPGSGVLLVRLSAGPARAEIPRSLVQALSSLPYTLVGRAVWAAGGRLLVDVRYRPPLAEALLGGMIPEGELWLLGGPDVGSARLELVGEEIDGADLLSAPQLPAATVPASGEARLPEPVAVRLVPGRGQRGGCDAVLIDDDELVWLQRFLMTRPEGEAERTFVLHGNGHHLVAAPGGLGGGVPFGIPLTRLGPGGLYVEAGLGFHPPLPEGARREVFALDDASVVAVVEDGVYRFAADALLPAWTLWAGAAPAVQSQMSARPARLVEALVTALSKAQPAQRRRDGVAPPASKADRGRLLREAQLAESKGDLVHAAECLEQAGELGQAGRLYEKAALAGS